MNRVRISLMIDADLDTWLKQTAADECVTISEIIRRALAVIVTYRQQMAIGRQHLGMVARSEKLDLEITGLLTKPASMSEQS